jgi:hypothetical protein
MAGARDFFSLPNVLNSLLLTEHWGYFLGTVADVNPLLTSIYCQGYE